jgi:signal transduction histidine kinase
MESGHPPDPEWSRQIKKGADRITGLVNEFLDVEQIKAGKLPVNLRECRLRTVVNQAIRDFRLGNSKREIIFEDEIGNNSDLIKGDYEKLLQVMNNLLENAAKFSSDGSEIRVKLKANDSRLIVRIKNKGRGIPKKEIASIFDKYYKGNKTNKDGMGLGLFLSKEIIEKHNGAINIFSKFNKGTTAEICLPCLGEKDGREN